MDLPLRDVVLRALDALRIPYSGGPGGGLEVRIPAPLRTTFRNRGAVRIVFDEEWWQHDREAELVTVGSPFLTNLEDALRASGTVSVVVGGTWTSKPEWTRDWLAAVTVLNGAHRASTDQVSVDTLLRITYEVGIPGGIDPPELVPVVWHPERGVLEPAEVARNLSAVWYTPEEVGGIGGEPLDGASVDQARAACAPALERRMRPVFSDELARRRAEIDREEALVKREATSRLGEARAEARGQIEAEQQERLARFEKARGATWRATERAIQVWRIAQVDTVLQFVRSDGRALEVPLLRAGGGRIRTDLCGTCTEIRQRYFLAPVRTGLLCESCAVECANPGCVELLGRKGPSLCVRCGSPRFCADHVFACSVCDQGHCVEHGRRADCCGSWLCEDHVPPVARDGRQLCRVHGRPCTVDGLWTPVEHTVECPITRKWLFREHAVTPPDDDRLLHPSAVVGCRPDGAQVAWDRADRCSVDGEWYRKRDLVTCPVTGRALYRGNAVQPDGDPRLLHPDAVVVCATSGTLVARDRAKPCAVDGAWHRPEHLVDLDGDAVCAKHVVQVDAPAGHRCRSDRVVVCAESGAKLAPEAAGICSVRRKPYDLRLLVTCPLTGLVLHHAEAVRPPDDDRMLHPAGCVKCAATKQWVARDRAVLDELAPAETWLSPSAAAPCEVSGKVTAAAKTVMVACCRRRCALVFASRSPISGAWACTQHRRECEEHGDYVLPTEAARCAISHRELCIEHTVETECGRRVAPVHAMRLVDGRYGCSDHYVLCTQSHPMARARALHCPECRLPVCPDHVGVDAFDPKTPRCAAHLHVCTRCGLLATHRDAGVCAWCEHREPVGTTDEAVQVFAKQVRPRLPLTTRMLYSEVLVSGSPAVRLFQVSAILGTSLYRVTADQVELRVGNTWKTV